MPKVVPQKRKRVVLSLIQKLEILDKLSQGHGVMALSREYGIGHGTVSDMKKDAVNLRKKILSQLPANFRDIKSVKVPKVCRLGQHENLDEAVFKWYTTHVDRGMPIRGVEIQCAADELAKELGIKDFKASNGWLYRFRSRHLMVNRKVCGESASAPTDSIDFKTSSSSSSSRMGRGTGMTSPPPPLSTTSYTIRRSSLRPDSTPTHSRTTRSQHVATSKSKQASLDDEKEDEDDPDTISVPSERIEKEDRLHLQEEEDEKSLQSEEIGKERVKSTRFRKKDLRSNEKPLLSKEKSLQSDQNGKEREPSLPSEQIKTKTWIYPNDDVTETRDADPFSEKELKAFVGVESFQDIKIEEEEIEEYTPADPLTTVDLGAASYTMADLGDATADLGAASYKMADLGGASDNLPDLKVTSPKLLDLGSSLQSGHVGTNCTQEIKPNIAAISQEEEISDPCIQESQTCGDDVMANRGTKRIESLERNIDVGTSREMKRRRLAKTNEDADSSHEIKQRKPTKSKDAETSQEIKRRNHTKTNEDIVCAKSSGPKKITDFYVRRSTAHLGKDSESIPTKTSAQNQIRSEANKWKHVSLQVMQCEENSDKTQNKTENVPSINPVPVKHMIPKDMYDVFGIHVAKTLRDFNNGEIFQEMKAKINDLLLEGLAKVYSDS